MSEEKVKDLVALTSFLMYYQKAHPGDMWGAYKVEEAIEALSNLTGFDIELLKSISGIENGEVK